MTLKQSGMTLPDRLIAASSASVADAELPQARRYETVQFAKNINLDNLLNAVDGLRAPLFVMLDEEAGRCCIGVGQNAGLHAHVLPDPDALSAWCSHIYEQIDAPGAVRDWPPVLFGAAFDATRCGRCGATPWRKWPPFLAWLPQLWLTARMAGATAFDLQGVCADRDLVDGFRRRLTASGAARDAGAARAIKLPVADDGDGWGAHFEAAKAALDGAEADKLVVARQLVVPATAGSHFHAPATLAAMHAAGGGTGFWLSPTDGAALVGRTPETLFRLQRGEVRTHALAGTEYGRTRAAGAAARKLAYEHELVARAVSAALSQIGEGAVACEPVGRRRVGGLVHWEQHFRTALASGYGAWHALAALHPTPAVAGTPTDAALVWLRAVEPFERGWYAGPAGWVAADGDAHVWVNLRLALVHPLAAYLYAGAGLVPDSRYTDETEEIHRKLAVAGAGLRVIAEGGAT